MRAPTSYAGPRRLILGLLGVSNETIIEDYLITQSQMGDLMDSWLAGGATDNEHYEDFQNKLMEHPRELVQPVFEADPRYIETLLDYVDETYGDFHQYALIQLE
ncbi:MAG: tyrosine-protein phosphatase [Pseudomonadota bacterium]